MVKLLLDRGADLGAGIEAAKEGEDRKMLDMLNRVKRSCEEKAILLAEVPKPHQEMQAGVIRMWRREFWYQHPGILGLPENCVSAIMTVLVLDSHQPHTPVTI